MVESFPAEDRGEVLEDSEYRKRGYGEEPSTTQGVNVFSNVTSLVEMDQFEAAAKRHRLKEEAAREKRDRKYKEKHGLLEIKGKENPYDSEEKEYDQAVATEIKVGQDDDIISNSYDSEFEAEFFGKKDPELNRKLGNRSFDKDAEGSDSDDQIDSSTTKNKKKQEKFDINNFTDDLDLNKDLKKFEAFKPAEGVSFVKYDILGNPITSELKPENKDDIRNYLAKDGDDAGFTYVAPNDEQMSKVLEQLESAAFVGGRKDVDLKLEKMNEEEKAVFDCMEDEQNVHEGAYEEFDDDFMMMLNDGKPALELAKEMKPPPILDPTHENAGVEIIEPEVVEHEMMIPNYKEKMADVIAMLDKQNEIRKTMKIEKIDEKQAMKIEKEAIKAVNQGALDEVFKSFMDNEYKDEQIGDLEGDEGVDPMQFIGDEDDMLDYGELSDGDMMSEVRPSQQDLMEEKIMQDNVVINEAVDEFIQDKRLWFRNLHR